MKIIIEGNSTIKIRYDFNTNVCSLYEISKIIATDAPNYYSTGNFYLLENAFSNPIFSDGFLNNIIDSKELDKNVIQGLSLFFELCEPGLYNLTLENSKFQYITQSKLDYHPQYSFASTDELLYFTKDENSLNRNIINTYKKNIEKGHKYVCLTFRYFYTEENVLCSSQRFLLDGHHKIKVYKELGISPLFLNICKQLESAYEMDSNFDHL